MVKKLPTFPLVLWVLPLSFSETASDSRLLGRRESCSFSSTCTYLQQSRCIEEVLSRGEVTAAAGPELH